MFSSHLYEMEKKEKHQILDEEEDENVEKGKAKKKLFVGPEDFRIYFTFM